MAWSNRRIAGYIMGQLDKLNIEYAAHGYCLGCSPRLGAESAYIAIRAYDAETEQMEIVATIRVADHAQPNGGGYSEERQARHGDTDIDVTPTSGISWREAVVRACLAAGKTQSA